MSEPRSWRERLSSLWIWEVWLENRTTFKLLVGDVVKFLAVMAIIYVGHFIIALLPISVARREFLELWHFLFTTVAWIWFCLTLLAEIIVDTLKRFKDSLRNSPGSQC